MDNDKFQNIVLEQMAEMMQSMTMLTRDVNELKGDVHGLKGSMVHLENKLDEKTKILFDGIQQHTDQLQRIEEKVSTHEEFIIKRIK